MQQTITFNIKAIKTNKKGDYIGLVMDNGFLLQYKDEKGKPIPLNKKTINQILGIKEQQND